MGMTVKTTVPNRSSLSQRCTNSQNHCHKLLQGSGFTLTNRHQAS